MSFLLALSLSMLMVACASAPERQSPTETNMSYVGSVERSAGWTGARVIWFNPPRRARENKESDA